MSKHKTLNDTIFRNSRYIRVVNEITNSDFRTEHKNQYDFMLDTFSSFILLFNCFNSDSNLGINDKVENALNICEEYLFSNFNKKDKELVGDKNINKYSVRFIQDICEKHSTHLYRRISEWYNDYFINYTPNSNISFVLEDIKKEMAILESISFDDYVKESINFKKDKNSDNKIFICKFNYIYSNYEECIEMFRKEYNENHINPIDDEELRRITNIYILMSKCCNGITKILKNERIKDYGIDERTNPTDLYYKYLDTLGISINSYSFIIDSIQFMLEWASMMPKLKGCGLDLNEILYNYDLYYFFKGIEDIICNKEYNITDEQIKKDLNDLIDIYKQFYKKVNVVDETLYNSKIASEMIDKLMSKKRIQDYFIRVS